VDLVVFFKTLTARAIPPALSNFYINLQKHTLELYLYMSKKSPPVSR